MQAGHYKARRRHSDPGLSDAAAGSRRKNLPAVVLPHGGPSARDEWGFDWLAQFLAARGYAVIQPNIAARPATASSGEENGSRAGGRRSAISRAAKWLVERGHRRSEEAGHRRLVLRRLCGAAVRRRSTRPVQGGGRDCAGDRLDAAQDEMRGLRPIRARRRVHRFGTAIEGLAAAPRPAIKAPVLLVHGDLDRNVGVAQSRKMDAALKAPASRPSCCATRGSITSSTKRRARRRC